MSIKGREVIVVAVAATLLAGLLAWAYSRTQEAVPAAADPSPSVPAAAPTATVATPSGGEAAAADAALPLRGKAVSPMDKPEFRGLHREAAAQASAEAAAAAARKERQEARQLRAAQREAEQLARMQAERSQARYDALHAADPRATGGLIVGDSVSLGSERCLSGSGYELDSEVGRQFAVGLQRLRVHAQQGFPDTVVVHLGTNGPFGSDGFHQAMGLLSDVERVVWVTIALPETSQYSFRDSLNDMITREAANYDNVRIADFGSAGAQHREWFFSDGVHPNGGGCAGFAELVNEAVSAPLG